MEIVPEIGRATSKPLLTQGENHYRLHCLEGIKSGLFKRNLTLIVASKSPGCVSNELLGISSISISSKGKIAKGEFYF